MTPELLESTSDGPSQLSTPRSVVVIGGGLAGMAAAVVLAERGARVVVLEKEAFLGGRVGAWQDALADGTPFEMERGLHAFFRQYYNLRNLLRRVDPNLTQLVRMANYPVLGGAGELRFSGLPPYPFVNALALILRTPGLRRRDLLRLNLKEGLALFTFDQARTYARADHRTAWEFLDKLRLPAAPRQLLFDVFAHSFFNPEESMSLAEMLMMFHFYFIGNPEGLGFDVMNDSYGKCIWQPLQRYVEARGAVVHTRTAAERLERCASGGWRVHASGLQPFEADAVVIATTVPGLQRVLEASPTLDDAPWRRRVAGLKLTLPFGVLRVWLDRPVLASRAPFVSTTGFSQLDSITVFEQFHRTSQAHARTTGGSVLELHAYAAPQDMPPEALRADLLTGLHHFYPETREARILEERFLYHQDCPAFDHDSHAERPGTETPWPTLTLAGDHIKLPLPTALMERATTAGFLAANHLLKGWSVKPEPVWSVPRAGILAPWLARLGR